MIVNVWVFICMVKVMLGLKSRSNRSIMLRRVFLGDIFLPIDSALCHVTLQHGCRTTGGILRLSDHTL